MPGRQETAPTAVRGAAARRRYALGWLVTVGGVLCLSPDALLVRLIAADLWTLLFWRGLLMALVLYAGLAVHYRRGFAASLRGIGWLGVLAAFLFALGTVCFVTSLRQTAVANTLVVVAAAPLFAALFGRLGYGERLPLRTWIAIAAAMAGILLLMSGGLAAGTWGDLWALGSAVTLGAYFALLRHCRAVDMTPAVALSGVMTALIAWPFAAPWAVTTADALWLGVLGLVVMPAAFGLISLGPRFLPAAEASLILLLETVLGPLWVWLALGEVPPPGAFLGGAIVLSALAGNALAALRR